MTSSKARIHRHFSSSTAVVMAAFAVPLAAEQHDLVIYGGSSAGIAAAVQAKRMGHTVIIVEPGNRIGGLTTGGLGQTDIGNKNVIGGIAREFYQDVHRYYKKPGAWKWQQMPASAYSGSGQTTTAKGEATLWNFEPSAALAIYQDWIRHHGIEVVYNERLNRAGEGKSSNDGTGFHSAKPGSIAAGVRMIGKRIASVTMVSGRTFSGRMFMDATYEGDLMAGAGVAFTVGREGRSIHGESLNGVRTELASKHNFMDQVDPYVIPGDPSSGLLGWIDPKGPGEEHASDHRIQAFCFRMCLTDHPENRIPFEKPASYDDSWYELLFRNFAAGADRTPWINSKMPNRKTDTNNRDGFSTDFIGRNYEWPEASHEQRTRLREEHLQYQKGLMWTLANHPRIPAAVRDEVSRWGLCKDEFTEGNGWQQQLYVREGRRMISQVIMTQQHCQREKIASNSVGMGAYNMDSHNVQRYVDAAGSVRNEGDVQVRVPPYPIDYLSIIPKENECTNLVIPVALGASHIAYGSIRMEPVFMILGQSGATAAIQAIEQNTTLAGIDGLKLRQRLLADHQILEFTPTTSTSGNPNRDIKATSKQAGIVVDDTQAVLTGPWRKSALSKGIGNGYLHDDGDNSKPVTASFTMQAPEDGTYSVQFASIPHRNRSSKTQITLISGDITEQHLINQRKPPAIANRWIPLVTLDLKAARKIEVRVSNQGANGHVIVDAVRLLKSP